jgi:hypothetical protein
MSKSTQSLAALVLASILLVPLSGCGIAGSATPPSLIPVKGKVTYKGKPLTTGVIQFEPDGFGRKARGQIQSDGTFVLTTAKEGDGADAGHHQVSISGTGNHPNKEVIPKKYTQRNSSNLTADVDAEHTEFKFDLN